MLSLEKMILKVANSLPERTKLRRLHSVNPTTEWFLKCCPIVNIRIDTGQ